MRRFRPGDRSGRLRSGDLIQRFPGRGAVVAAGIACAASAPLPAGAQSATSRSADFENGRQQFHRTCAQCHGRNMINSGITSYDLRKFPADQEERFVASVMNGKGNMPGYKDALNAVQLRGLWVYVSNRGTAPK